MMITERKIAEVHGRRQTARDCDCCLRNGARWYCVSDDAFLCQACDTLVHSANQLASRHERVKLETSPLMAASVCKADENCVPFWHQRFTRKARTPRQGRPSMAAKATKQQETIANHLHSLVPEIGSEETTPEYNEEQLQYCVPVFDPFAAELCSSDEGAENDIGNELNALLNDDDDDDIELAEFAADVESLLGTGLEDEQPCEDMIKDFGDVNGQEQKVLGFSFEEAKVKVEVLEDEELQAAMETLNWDFDCTSSMNYGEEEEGEYKQKVKGSVEKTKVDDGGKIETHKKMLLRLNYEAVMAAWGSQGSPWTNGKLPDFNPDGCLSDIMGISTGEHHQLEGREHARASKDGREARVSRYREKRRTRLFSKKIRYAVRKLNAEKRPRMKGRFVKRTSIVGLNFS